MKKIKMFVLCALLSVQAQAQASKELDSFSRKRDSILTVANTCDRLISPSEMGKLVKELIPVIDRIKFLKKEEE